MGAAVLALLVVALLAKIVLIDSPVGAALGDAIRNLVPARDPHGSASDHEELDALRRDVDALHERIDRVVEEQAFLTELLAEPRRLSLESGRPGTEESDRG